MMYDDRMYGQLPLELECECSSHGGFLTAKGLREAAQRERELDGVDAMAPSRYLDRSVSLSAVEDEDDDLPF